MEFPLCSCYNSSTNNSSALLQSTTEKHYRQEEENQKIHKMTILLNPGCGQVNSRIVGGQNAQENQFPWQCGILNSDNSFFGCGATIISCDPVIIVSAAHCFQDANV